MIPRRWSGESSSASRSEARRSSTVRFTCSLIETVCDRSRAENTEDIEVIAHSFHRYKDRFLGCRNGPISDASNTGEHLAIRSVHIHGREELRMAGAIIGRAPARRGGDDGLVDGAIGVKLGAVFGQSYRLLGCLTIRPHWCNEQRCCQMIRPCRLAAKFPIEE